MRLFARHGRTVLFAAALTLSVGAYTAQAQPQYWVGGGGKGIRLAVLEPVGKGLSDDERWMLSLVQGSITGDFNKYSAMTVIDRQNLEKVLREWEESMSGNYAEENLVKIGNLTSANHILTGSISKTASAYMLELSVTDVASGVRRASYSPTPISPMALENLSAVKAASADLLRQLGVELTSAAQSELKQAVNIAQVQAQTMLSRGIVAQRRGTEVAALSYFYQAASFDPSLFEAADRSKVMAANISSGNIGADIRNEIVWRKNWKDRLAETEETFYNIIKSADPPYTLFYSTRIKTKRIHHEEETADLSVSMNLVANVSWFRAMDRSLLAAKAVLDGLNSTKKKDEWGLGGWPWNGVTQTNPFERNKQYDIAVVFELVNQYGRVIGSQTLQLNPSFRITVDGSKLAVSFEDNTSRTIEFNGVRADDITDDLTIRVASINGKPPQGARFAINAVKDLTECLSLRVENGIVMGYREPSVRYYAKLDIPSDVCGQPITGIGDGAFANSSLWLVSIPSSVTAIGERAFENNNITQITLGDNVTIGNNALPDDFIRFYYNDAGRKADTYIYYRGGSVAGWKNAAGDKSAVAQRIAEADNSNDRTAALTIEKKKARNRMIWLLVTAAAVCVIRVLLTDGKGGQ